MNANTITAADAIAHYNDLANRGLLCSTDPTDDVICLMSDDRTVHGVVQRGVAFTSMSYYNDATNTEARFELTDDETILALETAINYAVPNVGVVEY